MKSILLQQVYPDKGFYPLVRETIDRNLEYCSQYQMDYAFFASEIQSCELGGWDKVLHIQRLFDYDLIVWLDADASVFDLKRDLRTVPLPADSIGAVKFMIPVPHLNVGVLYVKPGKRVAALFHRWLSEFPGEGAWREQAVFNKIRNECVVELPQEWNRNFDNNAYANPRVMGFHGFGSAADRLNLIRKYGYQKEGKHEQETSGLQESTRQNSS